MFKKIVLIFIGLILVAIISYGSIIIFSGLDGTDFNGGRLTGTLVSKMVVNSNRTDLVISVLGQNLSVFCGSQFAASCATGAPNTPIDVGTVLLSTGGTKVTTIYLIVHEE